MKIDVFFKTLCKYIDNQNSKSTKAGITIGHVSVT